MYTVTGLEQSSKQQLKAFKQLSDSDDVTKLTVKLSAERNIRP